MTTRGWRMGVVGGACIVAAVVALSAQTRFGDLFKFNNGTVIDSRSGDPEGSVAAPIGSVFLRTSNGKWYRKATGSTSTGWLQVSPVFFSATDRILCRDASGSGDAEECSASQLLDMLGSTRGAILYRGDTAWSILTPGSLGDCLQSGGPGADPSFGNCLTGSAGGDVTAAIAFGTDNCLIRSDGSGKGVQVSQWCVDNDGVGTDVEIDAEGSGNIITIPAKYIFPWSVCQGGTGSLVVNYKSNAPTAGCITGSNIDWPMATFPDSDGEYGGIFYIRFPGDQAGVIDIRSKWRTAATSGDIVVQARWACTADNETANDTWSSASTTTETANGTTLRWNSWAITGVTFTGCGPDERLAVNVFRQRTHASDSLSGTFDMTEEVEITIRRGM